MSAKAKKQHKKPAVEAEPNAKRQRTENEGEQKKWLVYGASGWIGGHMCELIAQSGDEVVVGEARLNERPKLLKEVNDVKPDFVVNAAGMTGRPNVDWCEDHHIETLRSNVLGAVTLADVCTRAKIPVTYFGTGCIYEYDDDHPIGGPGFSETDPPNFKGSYYSESKILVEELLVHYPKILTLRLRMPISDDLHPRSFVTKITNYEKVVDVPNSVTILHDLLPIAVDMTRAGKLGVYNFCNPGTVSHNEILTLYKEIIDPEFTWENFSLEEQKAVLKAGRSNNTLNVDKLLAEYPDIPTAFDSVSEVFKRMKALMAEKDYEPPVDNAARSYGLNN